MGAPFNTEKRVPASASIDPKPPQLIPSTALPPNPLRLRKLSSRRTRPAQNTSQHSFDVTGQSGAGLQIRRPVSSVCRPVNDEGEYDGWNEFDRSGSVQAVSG